MAILLALALALGAVGMTDREAAAEAAGNALGLKALARLNDGEHNQFVSPVSLGIALSMAALGAEGDTARELLDALGVSDPTAMADMGAALEASGLKCANAAFICDDYQAKQSYIDGLSGRFGAELFPLRDVDRVNEWVAEKTDHLIESLVDGLPDDTRLMLVNAVAMDAEWERTFDPASTVEDVFYAPSGDVEAQYMRGTFTIAYGENDLGQFARLDYRNSGLYMLVALPKIGRLYDLIQALAEDCEGAIPGLTEQRVRIILPKLDISTSNDLVETLQALGVKAAFTDDAEFAGIGDEPVHVSDVVQKVRVQLDEEGTRAAAATGIAMSKSMAVREQPVLMEVDRPFVMLIVDEATGAVCFAGTVYDPTQK